MPDTIKKQLLLNPEVNDFLTSRKLAKWTRRNSYCARFHIGQNENFETIKHLFAVDVNKFMCEKFGVSCSFELVMADCYALVFAESCSKRSDEFTIIRHYGYNRALCRSLAC